MIKLVFHIAILNLITRVIDFFVNLLFCLLETKKYDAKILSSLNASANVLAYTLKFLIIFSS